jgi:transcriptional regulator with XRE-family HTH domain
MKGKPSITDQLRQAIQTSGLSLNELERRCGVSHAVLSRFMTGKRTLTLPLAGRVCETLGLVLSPASGAGIPTDPAEAKPTRSRPRKGG